MGHLQRFNFHLQYEAQYPDRKIFSDGDFATSYLYPLIHRFLSMSGDAIIADETDINILQAVRLGSLLYTAEIRHLFGINGVAAKFQTQKLRLYLQRSTDGWDDLCFLRIWCLAMGGMESDGADREWFREQIVKEGVALGFRMWHDLETQMEEMIWFSDAHRPKFWALYHGFDDANPGMGIIDVEHPQYPELPGTGSSSSENPYPEIGW